tara:strand:+ start:623 stop:820 length:198 start_codon:yes stop_codon:yes gene_type:complete
MQSSSYGYIVRPVARAIKIKHAGLNLEDCSRKKIKVGVRSQATSYLGWARPVYPSNRRVKKIICG